VLGHPARLHEIAAEGVVIESPAQPRQQDACHGQHHGHGPHFIHLGNGHEVAVKADVGIEQVHQGVMHGIERITQFAQHMAHVPRHGADR